MPWPSETEAEDKLHAALHVIEETRGYAQTIAFLQQELSRLKVVNALQSEAQKLLPAPAAAGAAAGGDVEALSQALEFYAAPDNYKTGPSRKSPVSRDGGKRARTALATLDRDDAETEGK